MTTVVERRAQDGRAVLFACDFSPPRGTSPDLLESSRGLSADFVSVAYNPGKSVRVNSALAAYWIKENLGLEVMFTVSTRDMNKIAIQSLLLGASLLGLENIVVVKGDSFNDLDRTHLKSVNDFRPTELIRAVKAMNEGQDFRGAKLVSPTAFCIGATIDLVRDQDTEISLTRRKIEQGTDFFILQSVFDTRLVSDFLEKYYDRFGEPLDAPVFCGVQVMAKESFAFGDVPDWVKDDLSRGRTGEDLASDTIQRFVDDGHRSIYLLAPILKCGYRDYESAQRVMETFRS